MLTKRDRANLLQDFKAVFVTKEELKKELFEVKTEILDYCNTTFLTKNEFFTRFDAVMYELKAMREEIAVFAYRQSEHSDQLEHLDIRFQTLEKKSPVT